MLRQDESNNALWVNSEWKPGLAGTFAVVIGVSRYEHLRGGSKPAKDTLGLEQLYVSALTAYNFFLWLRSAYQYPNRPLAKCWLLLSPSKEELAFAAKKDPFFDSILKNAREPTFVACQRAIRAWHTEMDSDHLSKAEAEKSGAIFFFTGHGFEVTQEDQILLPSDYLAPGSIKNDAIGVPNLKKGLASIDVKEQFLFLDACRNDHAELRKHKITGQVILDEEQSYLVNKQRSIPTFHGSASGTQAWSPRHPSKGVSVFGKALLSGLKGDPGIEVVCHGGICTIYVSPLHDYMDKTVVEILRDGGAKEVEQPIVLGGPFRGTLMVTQFSMIQPQPSAPPPPTPPTDPLQNLTQVFRTSFAIESWNRNRPLPPDFRYHYISPRSLLIFGSDAATAIWKQMRSFSLTDRRWLEEDSDFSLYSLSRDDNRRIYDVDLAFDNPGDHWLEINQNDRRFAILLPWDSQLQKQPHYRLTLFRNQAGNLISIRAKLSSIMNEGQLDLVSRAWVLHENHRTDKAVQMIASSNPESPLGATIAGAILLAAGEFDAPGVWEVLDQNSSTSEAIVFSLEHRLRQRPIAELGVEDIDRFLEIGRTGLPRTSLGLSYALRQVRDFRGASKANVLNLDNDRMDKIESIYDWLSNAVSYFRTGSFFTLLSGLKEEITPSLEHIEDEPFLLPTFYFPDEPGSPGKPPAKPLDL